MSEDKSKLENSNETHAPDEFWCYFLGGIMVLCLGIFLFVALSKTVTGSASNDHQFVAEVGHADAASIANGNTLYNNCAACHGAQAGGNQQFWAPALAHLQPWYIVAQYKKFKDGHRGTDPKDDAGLRMLPMGRILKTDEDIADVAAYIHTFKNTPLPEHTLTAKGDEGAP